MDDDLKERRDAIQAPIRALPGKVAFGLLGNAISTRNALEATRRRARQQRSADIARVAGANG